MNQKELNEPFMMISNCKKIFYLQDFQKKMVGPPSSTLKKASIVGRHVFNLEYYPTYVVA